MYIYIYMYGLHGLGYIKVFYEKAHGIANGQ